MPNPKNHRRTFLARAGARAGAGIALPLLAAQGIARADEPKPRRGALDVRDFGALGDGKSDNTQALQAALDAASNAGGGAVLVPAGVYLTRTLTIRSRVHLAGEGIEATVFKLRDGTNADLIRTHNAASLAGANSTEGPFNWSIRDLTLDGNRARNLAGCGLRIYGWGYLLRDLRIRQCARAGIDSEWGTGDPPWSPDGLGTPGDSMEAQFVNLKVHHCGAGGIDFRGPHDTQMVNCVVYDNKTVGIHLGQSARFSSTGCQLVNCHIWGEHVYGIKVEAGYVTLIGCNAEWASAAQVHINAGDTTVSAGFYFGNPKARHVGIEIGSPDRVVYGTKIDARMADLNGGALKFTNEGGSGQIQALIYQRAGVAYTGRPARGTRLELLVNGINEGSTTWLPRGPLGWNGGTPIVRHLSGTTEWVPRAVEPGGSIWTEVKVEGASLGDTVAVGYSRPVPPGVLITGAVTGPDVVAVTLFNATGHPLRLEPGRLRADCWVH